MSWTRFSGVLHWGLDERARAQEPVVIAMHLISTGVVYINYGKSEINTEPFQKPLAQTLYNACKFYHHYKRGGTRRRVGQKSIARQLLVKELNRRAELRLHGPLPRSERTTQQGLYYKIRKAMGGKMDIRRDSFISAILSECRSNGWKRAELGIFAAVRSEMYFRAQVYQISWESIKDLAQKGSDVILIEKEGIALALAPYAEKRGVALVNSRGFIVDYAKDLLELSRRSNANLFQITDLDDSGLLISSQVPEIPRIGIDLRTLSLLDLIYEEVAEEYNPKKHIKALTEIQRRLVAKKRIEIDSILAEVGPERLWNHLEERMLELAPTRDLTRSIDLSVELPLKIIEPLNILTNWIKSIGYPKQTALIKRIENWDMDFTDINEMEKKLQSDIVEVIEADVRTEEVSKALYDIIEKIQNNFK